MSSQRARGADSGRGGRPGAPGPTLGTAAILGQEDRPAHLGTVGPGGWGGRRFSTAGGRVGLGWILEGVAGWGEE